MRIPRHHGPSFRQCSAAALMSLQMLNVAVNRQLLSWEKPVLSCSQKPTSSVAPTPDAGMLQCSTAVRLVRCSRTVSHSLRKKHVQATSTARDTARTFATGLQDQKLKILAVLYKAGDAASNPRLLGTAARASRSSVESSFKTYGIQKRIRRVELQEKQISCYSSTGGSFVRV